MSEDSYNVHAKSFFTAKVKEVIYDGTNPQYERWGGYDSIGRIFFSTTKSKISKAAPNEKVNLDGVEDADIVTWDGTAVPLFQFQKNYPLINETVLVIASVAAQNYQSPNDVEHYYLPPINVWNNPHANPIPAVENYIKDDNLEEDDTKIEKYIEEGLVRRTLSEENNEEIEIPFGKYFRNQLNIKPLLPYEGDVILERYYRYGKHHHL